MAAKHPITVDVAPLSATAFRDGLLTLRPHLAAAAQRVIDDWHQDEDGYDEEFGSGGACDAIATVLAATLADVTTLGRIETVPAGQDGDDHAWIIVYNGVTAFHVDIPPSVYERGGGYSWQKREGVQLQPSDVVIDAMAIEDLFSPDELVRVRSELAAASS